METGSGETASSTTQSAICGAFLKTCKLPRIGAVVWDRAVSETVHLVWAGHFAPLVSGAQNPVPGAAIINGAAGGMLMRQAEHRVLARPLCWRIAQAGDADPARQSALDGSPHQVGCKERER